MGCLFVLFRVSFTVQKLLIPIFFVCFVFVGIILGGGSEKMLLWFMSESVWPLVSSKSFIASGLISRSFIHCEFLFVFIVITLGGGSEKMLLWFMSESVWPMFSSKSFIVSGLIFRSLTHCEFFSMCGFRKCLISFFYMWLCRFASTT